MDIPWLQIKQSGNLVVATIKNDYITGELARDLTADLGKRVRYHNATYFVLDLAGVKVVA